MTNTIDNTDDVIDSRDAIARIDDLQTLLGNDEGTDENWQGTDEEWEELAALKYLAVQCEQYAPDWEYGATLIRDSYFTDYAREMLEDCGDIPKDLPHYIAVDWDRTAENIRVDYTSVDFGGVTYWVR